MGNSNDLNFNFEESARKSFAFLLKMGFQEIDALPTLVRFRKNFIEVDVYHGRKSFEIGAGITAYGIRYSISEIIRSVAPEVEKGFRYKAVTQPEGVAAALDEIGSLIRRFGRAAFDGDPIFFYRLLHQRQLWAEEYALDVLARQLRPKAEIAFRQKDYSKAANLYSRIKERLSPAEIKKLDFAVRHSK